MGNIQNEAYPAFEPRSLEFQSIHKSGINSIQYTSMVDNGQISRSEVISSSRFGIYSGGRYGYGLCGFTDPTIKEYLCKYTIDKGLSVGDLKGHTGFFDGLSAEVFPKSDHIVKDDKFVPTARTAFLHDYERPANIGQEQAERTRDAQTIYQEMINSNS
ncbi:MAG: phage tail tip lysozyme [Lachnospiraceae bacterium]